MISKGDVFQLGPWTYKVCKIEQQTEEATLFYAIPLEKETLEE